MPGVWVLTQHSSGRATHRLHRVASVSADATVHDLLPDVYRRCKLYWDVDARHWVTLDSSTCLEDLPMVGARHHLLFVRERDASVREG